METRAPKSKKSGIGKTMENDLNNTAALYVRWSSTEKTNDNRGDQNMSLAAQKAEAEKFAQSLGLTVVKIYSEPLGTSVSRFSDKETKVFNQALEDADELQKQRVILAPEAFRKEERKFRRKTANLQRKVQQRNQEFIRLKAFATRKYEQERAQALLSVAKKNNFTLVLRRREVLVSADFLDITKMVLETLNARKKSFKLPDDINKIEN